MPKILVLEDDPDILEMLSSELEYLGFRILRANSCKQASKLFDLSNGLLSDGELPDGYGIEVIAKFKESFPFKPTALFSGNSEIVRQAEDLGFVDLALSKSDDIEKNLSKISKLFNQ